MLKILSRTSIRFIGLCSLVVIAVAMVTAVALYPKSGVRVTLHNRSDIRMRECKIIFAGGTTPLPDLLPKQSATTLVDPSGASALTVTWIDDNNVKHRRAVDVYLEPGFRWEIDVRIFPNQVVETATNISVT